MRQEVSVTYQAVKSRVTRLTESITEEGKTTKAVQDSLKRWWNSLHPNDRPVARKHLLAVLSESDAAIEAIREGTAELEGFGPDPTSPFALSRLHALKLITPESPSRSAQLRN